MNQNPGRETLRGSMKTLGTLGSERKSLGIKLFQQPARR
jgi:hypothetical protein